MTQLGRILILEDDPGIATLESRKVKNLGYDSVIASDTKTALNLLKGGSFEAIILDYNLGEKISGVEFYNLAKENGIFIPAILVTGLEDPQILLKAIRAGIRDFVPKLENFLDDLAAALERVMKQAKAEKDSVFANILREKNELLESVVSASGMCSVRTKMGSETLQNWHGDVEKVFGSKEVFTIRTRSKLLDIVLEEDSNTFTNHLIESEEGCASFTCHIRFKIDPHRWIFVQGKCYSDNNDSPNQEQTLVMVFFDVTERKLLENNLVQSSLRMEAMNKRLHLGMSEAHHRIKNSLQNISSLLNLNVRKSGNLSEDEAKKLSSHIQGLAKMHELLLEQTNEDADCSSVNIAPIIDEIARTIQKSIPHRKLTCKLEEVFLPSRMACTISVIVNELLSNAIKHGNGKIDVSLNLKDDMVDLEVSNQGSQFPENLKEKATGRNGLTIIDALAKGDLGSSPVYSNISENTAVANIKFRLVRNENSLEAN